jgi:hypothetical protein
MEGGDDGGMRIRAKGYTKPYRQSRRFHQPGRPANDERPRDEQIRCASLPSSGMGKPKLIDFPLVEAASILSVEFVFVSKFSHVLQSFSALKRKRVIPPPACLWQPGGKITAA